MENDAGGMRIQGKTRLNSEILTKKTTKTYFKIKILLLIYFQISFSTP